MARFTQEQLDEAVAEFFSENVQHAFVPAAGQNGPITVYKGANNGDDETASE